MGSEPYRLSATEAIREIGCGRLTTEEWVQSCLLRIQEVEPSLHAWTSRDDEASLSTARAIDRRRQQGLARLPFEGAPLGIKDIFNTHGNLPTQMGSCLWKGFLAGNDARVVATLRRKGCVIMGKTETSEFAVHAPGPTVHPYDSARTPGTSSSGSAVAVAVGMVPLALGSQTAGSTIRPASYCGVYGFKPSFGLVPRTGMLKTTDTLDHVTFFSRTVEDMALIFDHARVSGSNHPLVAERIDGSLQESTLSRWRVGFVRGPGWSEASPYARQAIEDFADQLTRCDRTTVYEVKLPEPFSHVHESHQRIYCRMLAYYFKEESRHPESVSSSFREMVEAGQRISLKEYQSELQFQEKVSHLLDRLLEETDVLLNLSTAGEAPPLEASDPPDNCLVWTFCGVPALNLPVFTGPTGLPFGAQLVARRYHDYPLLRFAGFLRAEGLAHDVEVVQPLWSVHKNSCINPPVIPAQAGIRGENDPRFRGGDIYETGSSQVEVVAT